MQKEKTRVVLAGIGLALAAGYALTASGMRTPSFGDPVGPRTFPYLVAGGLALSSIGLLAEHVAAHRRGETQRPEGVTRVAVVAVCLLAGYCLMFEPLGFIPATAIFLLVFLTALDRGALARNFVIAAVVPVVTWFLLGYLLGAPITALPG